MTDRLERALRSLREDENGANPHSEETLDRILASRRSASGVWTRRARLWIPIAAVLALATSALARSGGVATIRAFVAGRGEVTETQSSLRVPAAGTSHAGDSPATADSSPVVDTASSEPASVPASVPAPVPVRAAESIPTASPSRVLSSAATPPNPAPSALPPAPATSLAAASSSTATAPATPVPSETDVYARAHRLHFDGGDPAGALAAWDEYLRQYPSGRFAPEARFNRAIDLLKMKRYAEARSSLRPFADGVFGGYHRDDARELLRSIP
jgi:hypothetical protein